MQRFTKVTSEITGYLGEDIQKMFVFVTFISATKIEHKVLSVHKCFS